MYKFFIAFSFLISSLHAQELSTVYYNYDDEITTIDSAYYFRKAVFREDEAPRGEVTDYYLGGQPYMQGNYVNAKRSGDFTWYYENGQMKETGTYKNGEYILSNTWDQEGNFLITGGTGEYNDYYPNRQKKCSGYYKKGKKSGVWSTWYPNGKKMEKWNYVNGEEMLVSAWDKNGILMVENGNGEKIDYYFTGAKKSQGNYKDGKREGSWQSWYSNGILKSYLNYVKGKRNGLCKFFFTTGKLMAEEPYEHNLRQGICNYYFKEGEGLRALQKFKRDTLFFSQIGFEPGNEIYSHIDTMPSPAFNLKKFFHDNIVYPVANQGHGTVIIGYIVTKDGKLTSINVEKGAIGGLDQESERVMKLMPAWNPGIYHGKKVNVKMHMPFNYRLTSIPVSQEEEY